MEDWGMNHDITPPSKVQRPDARCWLRVRSLRVGAVEFGDELLGALYIADGVRATLRRGHSYTKILRDRGEPNRRDTLTQW